MSAAAVTAPGFASVVREATRPEHEAAEGSSFMAALTSGQLGTGAYAALLAQTYFVYEVLEQAAEAHRRDAVAGPFVRPELTRLPSLAADLAHLIGPGWQSQIAPLPATSRYCTRLREVAFDWPGGFVAHHYTRYLGDLSGGQILRRFMERYYGLTDAGVRFYIFDGIEKVKPFRDEYRGMLDDAGWDADEQARIVAEVRLAFELNKELFDDLGELMDQWRIASA